MTHAMSYIGMEINLMDKALLTVLVETIPVLTVVFLARLLIGLVVGAFRGR